MKQAELLTTGFGLGKLPWFPAVWGSLPPVILYQVLGYLGPGVNVYVMLFFVLVGSWVCIKYTPALVLTTGQTHPTTLVADRIAGQGLTMFIIALVGPANICNSMALGFALFRLFDVIRINPGDRLNPTLNILVPTLLAGFYAGLVSFVIILLFPGFYA